MQAAGRPDLPSGTVTFLFTDIEASTSLLKQLRDHYGEVLADHRRLLRDVVRANGGREVDAQGDAFFFVFRSATSAVAAAVAGQRALAAHPWPEGIRLSVRMGLHTGDPSLGEHGYLGLAVHRAARICSVAHGGQVLLSRSTSAVLEDERLDGISLRELGDHRLKDIDRPERLYQLLIDGLLNDLRPPKAYDAQPVKATAFGGQEDELARAAQAALASRRMRIIGWVRPRLASRGIVLRENVRLVGAAFQSTSARLQLLAAVAVVTLVSVFQPWLVLPVAVAYVVLLVLNLRSQRFFRCIGGIGLKVHSLAGIASDDDLRAAVRSLGGTMVRVGRLLAEVDEFLSRVSRRSLAHRLEDVRRGSSASPASLRQADILAQEIAAFDVLVEQRRALDEERRKLESGLGPLRDRVFDARLNPTHAAEVRADVSASREKLSAIAADLGAAFAVVRSCSQALDWKPRRLRA